MDAFPAANTDIASLYAAHVAVMQERVAAALDHSGSRALIVLAGEISYPPRDDVGFPFRVEPHFAAWLPLLHHPGCGLRIEPGSRPLLAYPQADDFWHVPNQDPEGFWVEHFDVRITKSANEAKQLLLGDRSDVAIIGDSGAQVASASRQLTDNILKYLDFFRAFKTDYELRCLERANRIAVRGHAAVHSEPRRKSEFALHQSYCTASRQRETELPYPNIVALNEHASILHYERLALEPPEITRSLLVDAGASFNGYAADVTRTWSEQDCRFAELVASMDRLQQAVCRQMVSGTDFVDVNEITHQLLAEVLEQHDLVKCSAAAAHDNGLTCIFLPHGLGHLLGLQVHDAGGRQIAPDGELRDPPERHAFLRLTRSLAQGMVVTVEPGLYFIESLLHGAPSGLRKQINWPLIDALLPYGGIRIEDDVVVTDGPCVNLTREAFAASQDYLH